jgi:hypothetical protein
MKRTIAIILTVTTLATIANAGELITNGGFETGDFTGWITGATSGSVLINTPFAHTGKYSAAMTVSNSTGDSAFMEQTVTETKLSDIASFDVWINTQGATVTLNILDGMGGLFSYDQTFGDTGRTWEDWNILSMISGGSLTQISEVDFEIDGQNGVVDNKVLFDDASIQTLATPEPASMLVLAPGLLFFARKRVRR